MTPDNLLVHPCVAHGAGDTVGSLAKGYVKNTSCLDQYRLLIEKQIKYKSEVEALHNERPK